MNAPDSHLGSDAACPICDGPVQIRATGRPPTYCGKICRQTAYRARQAAARAVADALHLRRELTVVQDAFRRRPGP